FMLEANAANNIGTYGVAVGGSPRTDTPTFEDGATATMGAMVSGTTLVIASFMNNFNPITVASAPTVNIRGSGSVWIVAQPFPSFTAGFNIDNSTLNLGNFANALGAPTNPIVFGSNGGKI